MILNKPESDVLIVGGESHGIGINSKNSAKLLYMLTQNLYEDVEKAVIREICSNIVDSYIHCEYDIEDKPGFVKLTDEAIYFIDQGSGMSRETVDDIYSNLLASTKEDDEDAIGAWGIGSKSPWAYSDTFYLTTCKDGDKRTYMLVKDGLDSKIILVSEEEGTEDGTTVTVHINNPRNWADKIIEVLACFRYIHVSYEGNSYQIKDLINRFNHSILIEGKSFFYRDGAIHNFAVALDQVIYNIPLSKLGIDWRYSLPIVLKMSLKEGFVPTPSRDNITLNESAKAKIKQRLIEALTELRSLHSGSCRSLKEWAKDPRINIEVEDTCMTFVSSINDLCTTLGVEEFPTTNPYLSHLTFGAIEYMLECYARIGSSGIKHGNYYAKKGLFIDTRNLNKRQLRFLKENYKDNQLLRTIRYSLWGTRTSQGYLSSDERSLHACLGLHKFTKDRWRNVIKAFLGELKDHTDSLKGWSDIEERYNDWEPEKAEKRVKGEIKEIYTKSFWGGGDWKRITYFDNKAVKYLFITESQRKPNQNLLKTLYECREAKTEILIVSETNLKYMMSLGQFNYYDFDTYISSKFFKRWVSNYYTYVYGPGTSINSNLLRIDIRTFKKVGKSISISGYDQLVDAHIKKSYYKLQDRISNDLLVKARNLNMNEIMVMLCKIKKHKL